MKKILLVDDEVSVVNFIKKGLADENYEVSVAFDGSTGVKMALEAPFDLIILDIMLPDKNGLEVCKEIRFGNIQTPILFLTALGASENVALGLDMGADDYLVKPFKFIELNARIKALIRRGKSNDSHQQPHTIYTIADLKVDDDAKTVERNASFISLTATEYRLLLVLIKNKGRVLSRVDLLESAWDINFNMETNVVDVYINYLRKKMDTDANNKLIHTVVGMGYVLKEI
ncbi:response regulator transcription factor [Haliscomenobacter hydrossis]|uniref:Two component transcriptional regulator, winged helix family n=1 Tax=Haliscomenobacter hydrossis (strain ATCC 27775 / DSM 1100 / LMG 10767 / O) TaxID=760192 RepID=F4KY74_HALH1|nr:response regulator transcription factor [Haliscomenobacter hydrossis]AEE48337.1 two component transcriptional regulator, winged helix family [Haliscomenobacter hydrossis DSM 1100]